MKSIIANAAFRGKSGSYLFGRGVRNATALGTRRYIQHKILNGSSFSSNCRILATLSPEQYFPFTSGQIIEKSSMKNILTLYSTSLLPRVFPSMYEHLWRAVVSGFYSFVRRRVWWKICAVVVIIKRPLSFEIDADRKHC